MIARKPNSSPTQGRTPSPLWLKIRGTERDGQLVQLTAPKCTIGSAAGCTLRLLAAGVRPVACLVLRGPHGTAVLSWADDTRLNGQSFGDSPLVTGDRLGLGPVELEVVEGMPTSRSTDGSQCMHVHVGAAHAAGKVSQ